MWTAITYDKHTELPRVLIESGGGGELESWKWKIDVNDDKMDWASSRTDVAESRASAMSAGTLAAA